MFKLKEDYRPHPLKKWHLPFLLLLIAGAIIIFQTRNQGSTNGEGAPAWPKSNVQHAEGSAFGTIYHITYSSPKPLSKEIEQVLAEVDHSLSPFNPNSVITAINNNTSTATDERFRYVYNLSSQISRATDGAFDITVAPLVNLWGFGFKNEPNVTDAAIDSVLQFVGMSKVSMQADTISKADPRLMFDCSAIAKGYGVDAMGLMLEKHGVKNYMVEIGGEVRVRGWNDKGAEWHIGITRPVDDSLNVNGELQDVVMVRNQSMATSGNYRNFYMKGNKKYAHTIDPHTGRPVQHSILSATVFADDCATADAYATAFMVMGLDKAKACLKANKALKAYLIYAGKNGEMATWHSDNLKLASAQ